ncbi:MAG: NHL repeat-containing protein [Deltaproteobacteria bacterium]|nr:NHL repeat-containing protein [Deltaproteobacteria bacterium]
MRHVFSRKDLFAVVLTAALMILAPAPARTLCLERSVTIVPSGPDLALLSPTGLWYDEQRGYLSVANPLLHQVSVLDRKGQIVKVLGKGGELGYPRAVAATRGGKLFIAGRESEIVKALDGYDAVAAEAYREIDLKQYRRTSPVQPAALFADWNGDLYVADRGNRQVLAFGADEKLRFSIADVGEPADIWVDRTGKIYVADPGFGGIRVYDDRGKQLRTIGTSTLRSREPLRIKALAVDARSRIWVVEEGGRGIKALDPLGNVIFSMSGEGLFSPADLAVDPHENLYVLEEGGNRISVFSIAGI